MTTQKKRAPWAPDDGISSTDCRSEEGITVGLIDSLMSVARVLRPRLEAILSGPYGADKDSDGLVNFHKPTLYALQDLAQDEDVLAAVGMAARMDKQAREWWNDHSPKL